VSTTDTKITAQKLRCRILNKGNKSESFAMEFNGITINIIQLQLKKAEIFKYVF